MRINGTKLSEESADENIKSQKELQKKYDSAYAVEDFTTRDVVLSDGQNKISTKCTEEKKEDLALALLENNHVEDALASWPSELCRPQALDAGEGKVKLPEGTVSASINVFFSMKNVKNLDSFTKPVLLFSDNELASIPTKPIPMELVNLSD